MNHRVVSFVFLGGGPLRFRSRQLHEQATLERLQQQEQSVLERLAQQEELAQTGLRAELEQMRAVADNEMRTRQVCFTHCVTSPILCRTHLLTHPSYDAPIASRIFVGDCRARAGRPRAVRRGAHVQRLRHHFDPPFSARFH